MPLLDRKSEWVCSILDQILILGNIKDSACFVCQTNEKNTSIIWSYKMINAKSLTLNRAPRYSKISASYNLKCLILVPKICR